LQEDFKIACKPAWEAFTIVLNLFEKCCQALEKCNPESLSHFKGLKAIADPNFNSGKNKSNIRYLLGSSASNATTSISKILEFITADGNVAAGRLLLLFKKLFLLQVKLHLCFQF